MDVDWQALTGAARNAMEHAYVPYSNYPVGAAALVSDGRVVSGCNVENAAYGVTLCAECGLVSDLVRGGGGRLSAFVCVDGRGDVLMPCGRCRQLLAEHAGPEFLVRTAAGTTTMEGLLPDAFGAVDLRNLHGAPAGAEPAAGDTEEGTP